MDCENNTTEGPFTKFFILKFGTHLYNEKYVFCELILFCIKNCELVELSISDCSEILELLKYMCLHTAYSFRLLKNAKSFTLTHLLAI